VPAERFLAESIVLTFGDHIYVYPGVPPAVVKITSPVLLVQVAGTVILVALTAADG
jgi:hypothetical protein